MKTTRNRLWIVLVCLLTLLVACSKDEEKKQVEDEEETSTTVEYPFTGEEASDEDELDHRAIAVMVNNHVAARPYTGLANADIVFEILAEGEITRFMALYHSDIPDRVGSVRSAREYYFELADGYDAIYTYHGAANFVNKMIKERQIDYINGALYDGDGVLFERTSDRKAPHNSYVLLSNLYEKAEELGYDIDRAPTKLPFRENGQASDTEATSIQVTYSKDDAYNPVFVYDAATDDYTRTVEGEHVVDAGNHEEIRVENLFIVEAEHHVFDSEGRREIDLESGGKAYLFSNGQMEEVEWKNESGRLIPIKDGKEIGFVPGKSWINVVPRDEGIDSVVTVNNE